MDDATTSKVFHRGVVLELERCSDCASHLYCTRHVETSYSTYEAKLKAALEDRCGEKDYNFQTNPGPKALGVKCIPSPYNQVMYTTVKQNPDNRRWYPETPFRYPRIGGFEVCAMKGNKRIVVFSKLKCMKWPNPEWLAERIDEVIALNLNGWNEAPLLREERTHFSTKVMTDEALRDLIKNKFATLIAAFRSFDKNGDGQINHDEFVNGMKNAGLDLPPSQFEQLWRIADEDNSGAIQYQEFARKFCSFKATHTFHRHADLRDDSQADIIKLHGVQSASRVQKHSALRHKETAEWGVAGEELDEDAVNRVEKPVTVFDLAKDPRVLDKPAAECSADMIRAKIYAKRGNLIHIFRTFEVKGESRISYEDFVKELPHVLDEPLSKTKLNALWRDFDAKMSGDIKLHEFSQSALLSPDDLVLAGIEVTRISSDESPSRKTPKGSAKTVTVEEQAFSVEKGPSEKPKATGLLTTDTSASTMATLTPTPEPIIAEIPEAENIGVPSDSTED